MLSSPDDATPGLQAGQSCPLAVVTALASLPSSPEDETIKDEAKVSSATAAVAAAIPSCGCAAVSQPEALPAITVAAGD